MSEENSLHLQKPIVLVGMMGCGKTYIGQEISKALQYSFIDTDSFIEQEQDMSCSDIFMTRGEQFFRQLEVKALRQVIQNDACVIATGGGLITTEENRRIIKDKACSIWVKSPIDVIVKRLKGDTSRPLLNGETDPALVLSQLQEQRAPFYEQADIVLENNGETGLVVKKALQAIQSAL